MPLLYISFFRSSDLISKNLSTPDFLGTCLSDLILLPYLIASIFLSFSIIILKVSNIDSSPSNSYSLLLELAILDSEILVEFENDVTYEKDDVIFFEGELSFEFL